MGMWKRVPIGPCSFISPFNFPLNLAAHKIAPAIAIGCPFVMKPASMTPLGAIIMGEVLAECEALGFGVEQIIAMKGPFDAELNRALYRACRCDLVITKESGAEGGYQEKVRPCLELGIPCIVIRRPHTEHDSRWGEIISTPDALKTCLAAGHEGSEQ